MGPMPAKDLTFQRCLRLIGVARWNPTQKLFDWNGTHLRRHHPDAPPLLKAEDDYG